MTSSGFAVEARTLVQVADYPTRATFGPRRLVDHEFVWILRGSAVWTVRQVDLDDSFVRERRYLLTPGTIALARAGTVDSYQWDEQRTSTHAYVHFRITDSSGLADEGGWPVTRSLRGSPILEGICAYLLELAGQQSALARRRSDEFLHLLLDLFVNGPLEEPEQALPGYLAAITAHTREVWDAEGMRIVGVPELARAANISVGHLFRLFRENYGCGPARAFELVRLARAAISLQRSNATISEIADLSGFANPYHFSRRFAAVYGTPPGTFRSLTFSPDPLEPVRDAGLLPFAHALLNYGAERGS
ncbi:MAG: AraC family transcriptional regulator [Propionibacteriaceae bacterium]